MSRYLDDVEDEIARMRRRERAREARKAIKAALAPAPAYEPLPEGARCSYQMEKRYPGRRYVEWRRQCRSNTRHPSGRCYQHRVGS